jgi:hypothetical protein
VTHPYTALAYAQSLDHCGEAFAVPEWGGVVVARHIDDTLCDSIGPYPVAVLSPGADLEGGLERLRQAGFVSVTLVLDDYHRPPLHELERAFDLVRTFKTHYVVDSAKGAYSPSRHHRYEINRALSMVRIETVPLCRHLEQWVALCGHLKRRHALSGVHDFTLRHYETLAALPGVTTVAAFLDEAMLAAHLWVEADGRVHSHLAASSEQGYASGAAYAVNDASIRLFSGARIVNLGGGAGNRDDPGDGLSRFKKGFANTTARSYICGKILDSAKYSRLCGRAGSAADARFFPAYRTPTDMEPSKS